MNIFSEEFIAGFRAGHDQGYAAGYEDARREIEDAAPQWRRVEEEMPKDYGDYLGYADGEVMFLLFNPDTTDKWKWSACDAEGSFDVSVDEVTHWMPLPEPPKEAQA